jgi:hypothetical protein
VREWPRCARAEQIDRPEYLVPLLYGQWAYHLTRGEHKLALSLTEQFDKFRQGCLYYQFIPTMQEARLRPLMEKFGQLLLEQSLFADIYGLI